MPIVLFIFASAIVPNNLNNCIMCTKKLNKFDFDFSRPRVRRNGRVLDKMALAMLLDSLRPYSYFSTILYEVTSYVEMRNLLVKIL